MTIYMQNSLKTFSNFMILLDFWSLSCLFLNFRTRENLKDRKESNQTGNLLVDPGCASRYGYINQEEISQHISFNWRYSNVVILC